MKASPLVFVLLGATCFSTAMEAAAPRENPPAKIASFFAPPPEFAGQFGPYKSPLKFYDGRPVASPAEWPARRAEILKYWHEQMGPWPELLVSPKLELSEKQTRAGGIVQHRVKIEVSPGVMQHGFLLVPTGDKPRPAVLVPFYVPEVSVAYQGLLEGEAKKMMERSGSEDRAFAWQLAQRGFVTLAIGSPNGSAYKFGGMNCQRLSYLAYIAANCHTALAQRPEVDPVRIGVMGHSYGGKWAMFASCLYEKFAPRVWSDPRHRLRREALERELLGAVVSRLRCEQLSASAGSSRRRIRAPALTRRSSKADTTCIELHALMAPRPFLVSGGSEDFPARWIALNHAIAVNDFLGFKNRVAMTNRPDHSPNPESNEQAFAFLEYVLGPVSRASRAETK